MDKSILILFATMTGNAEYVAKAVGEAARARGYEPTLVNVCDFGFDLLAREARVLLVASTYGEGDPPPDAEDFQSWLLKQQPPLLAGQRFAVYSLGDTSYDQFCGFGKRLDSEFERLGAQRIAERSDNDIDYEAGQAAWIEAVFAGLEKNGVGRRRMNPNLHRHLFVRCPSEAQRTLPDHSQFTAERGERCVPLTVCWPELLSDCGDLGAVALVSQNSGAQFARCVTHVDFAPVPGSTEMVELRSGLVADTSEWSHALAVEEPIMGGSLFSLQFFAWDGAGLWKLLLTRDAQLEHFAGMIRHYASGSPPPEPREPQSRATASRLVDLQRRGCAYAHEVPRETLAITLLTARREGRGLQIGVGRGALQLSGSIVPRSLERCPCALHAYDHNTELHLATGENFSAWRVLDRGQWSLEILDAEGQLTVRIGG